MPGRADGAGRRGNAAAAKAQTSFSSSNTTSDAYYWGSWRASGANRFIHPPERLGLRGVHDVSEQRMMRRPDPRASTVRVVTTAEASSQTTYLPELGTLQLGGNVAVRQVYWPMNHPFKKVLLATAITSAVAIIIYLVSTVWIHFQYHHVLHAASRDTYADHAGLSLFSGCDSTACQAYMGAIESSVNRSHDPCQNFYRFICDGWQHQHRLLSVLDAAQNMMYSRALSNIEWAPRDIRTPDPEQSAASVVEKRVVELARSCIELSESSLERLKMFMAEHHLPWPMTSRRDLLGILLDLSGNWNLHLWFQVTFDLTRSRNITGGPVLKIGHSVAFRAWIASMRTFVSQPKGTVQSVRYQQHVHSMLRLFDVPETQAADLIATIEAMNRLTMSVLGPAVVEPEQTIRQMSIRNLAETTITGTGTKRLLLLLNEHFSWAQWFSSDDIAHVENPALLHAVAYLLGLKSETKEALMLSLGFRVAQELGWMADKRIADVTLELMGLPASAHSRRCLVQIENSVGVAWLSLFSTNQGFQALVEDITEEVIRRSWPVLDVRTQGDDAAWRFLASVLPAPTPGAGFFLFWLKLMSARWRLQQHDLTNILKPGSVLRHRWSIHATLTVSHDYFVFPLYHPDLPPAVNYGGAGRLIADEILRNVFQDPTYKKRRRRRQPPPMQHRNGSLATESPSKWSPHHLDTMALLAALNGYRQDTLRRPTDIASKEFSLAQDRLFFVSSCYALCSSGDFVDEVYGEASRRCNEPLTALSEFRAAFKCEKQNHLL